MNAPPILVSQPNSVLFDLEFRPGALILILDEATSSVVTRTERLIQRAFDQLLEGRTSFVIAHRLSTIQHADQVLMLKAGRIVERGTHQQLLANRGPYYDLYMSQFRREEEPAAVAGDAG